jgi:ATP-dependent protease ClpP protease subunit
VAEALACCEGLALADDLGLQTARVAMDCANAARSMGAMILLSWRSREERKALPELILCIRAAIEF